jgi:voltage-gated potassium channel
MANTSPEEPISMRRRSRLPRWFPLFWRVAAVSSLMMLMVLFHWLERDGLVDELDGEISFLDAIYFTMISATTTGYGDIVPVTDRTRMFDALVVTPVRIFLLLIFVGSAYMFVARQSWEGWLMRRIQAKLKDHIIVAGYGIVGSRAVQELVESGVNPKEIVVIDVDENALAQAQSIGCAVLRADATQDAALKAVHIGRARALMVSGGRDDTSILICLTARHLAPDLQISVVVRSEDNELPARQAGVDVVINPVTFSGTLLAGSAEDPHVAEYLADLSAAAGKVKLLERKARAEEVGKALSQITTGMGVRIRRRNRPHGFWEPEAQRLEEGDMIVEIVPEAWRSSKATSSRFRHSA